MVTPVRTKERLNQRFMVAYGYGQVKDRVVVFNPRMEKIRVRKGSRVAEFHPGGVEEACTTRKDGEDRSVRFPSCPSRADIANSKDPDASISCPLNAQIPSRVALRER